MSDKILYTLTDSGDLDSEQWAISIDSGKYKRVIYQYGVISLLEGDETARVKFSYDVIDDNDLDLHTNKAEFELTLGDILREIFEEIEKDSNGQNGNNNPEEPHSQRGFHEEGVSISEERVLS